MACLIATLNQESLWKTIKQVQSKPEDDESNLKHCFSRSNALFAFKHSITPYVTKAFTRSKLLYIEPVHATAKTTGLANSSSWPQQQALSPQNCDTITSQGFKPFMNTVQPKTSKRYAPTQIHLDTRFSSAVNLYRSSESCCWYFKSGEGFTSPRFTSAP